MFVIKIFIKHGKLEPLKKKMMKRIFYFVAIAALMCGCVEEVPDEGEAFGKIYGIILDKTTAEPVRGAGVLLNPTGDKTVTGNEGQYEFTELKAGEYTISVTKTGYSDLTDHKIIVSAGKTSKGDAQIEELLEALRIVDDKAQNIDALDFGSEASVTSRSFNIFNGGHESLKWLIAENCPWIAELSATGGTLQAGAQQSVLITIDREKLGAGSNSYILSITSDKGSKELTISAVGVERGLPSLNTLETSNIAANTATFNGKITATGSPAYTERGFVYATTPMPTIENTIAKLTVAVTDSASYSASATGLTLNRQYYVRAYAINSVGVAYSTNEINFTTMAIMPTLTTQAVTNINIAAGTATFNGTIETIGDPAYTERGFVYGTTNNPTIADIKVTASGTGTGAYSAGATEIAEGQTYYVRAYATNDGGTAYGEEMNFVTVAGMPEVSTQAVTSVNISAGTVTFNGTIVSAGDLSYTERGFVYGTTHNPTLSDTKKVATGTGIGIYSLNVSDVAEGYTYYVRAYATNSKGTVYGEEVDLDFNAVMPTLSTQAATNINIGAGTATFNGTIQTSGDPAYTERGFVYATTHNPTIDDTKVTVSGRGTGAYSVNVADITVGNIYFVRAYATGSKGTTYGAEVDFDFRGTLPTLTTQTVSGIDATVATFNATVESLGEPSYTERGFVYSLSVNPSLTSGAKVVASGNSAGSYSVTISGLSTGTVYYVKAYATNYIGTSYGEEVSFTAEVQPFVELTSLGVAVSRVNTTSSYQVVSWVNANNFCQNSTVGGYSDWRLPTISELTGIYENKNLFTNLHERTNYEITQENITAYVYDFYWSSSPSGSSAYSLFSFYNGVSPGSSGMTNSYETSTANGKNSIMGFYARCVRTVP
jgi:hypothetical protein